MANGNQRLLENNPDKTHYSAMEMEDRESSSESPLIDSENQSSLRINKRALVVFFGVTCLAAAVIIVAVFVTLYSGNSGFSSSRLKRDRVGNFTIDDFLDGTYSPLSYDVNWISDYQYTKSGPGGSIELVDKTQDKTTTLVDGTIAVKWDKHFLSPSYKYFLVAKDLTSEYRYSTYAHYYIFDVKTKKEVKIKSKSKIQYAQWSPANDAVVYVTENDMYYISDVTKPDDIKRLTNTGKKHVIFNGVPDWVYQEEVLNSDHALYFSKDGNYLTYIQFNDSKVEDFVFSWFGPPNKEYISQHKIAYPKPGTGNPEVAVKVIDLSSLQTKTIPKPATMLKYDHYVVEIEWLSNTVFSVQWLNRTQDYSITKLCLVEHGVIDCDTLKGHEVEVKGGWVDDKYMKPMYYNKDNRQYYLVTHPFPQGNAGHFIHIGKVDILTGQITPLTSGEWVVTKMNVFDDVNEIVYFESTLAPVSDQKGIQAKGIPSKRHIYSLSIKDNKMACLSCDAPGVVDGSSGYFKASFSTKGGWFILHSLGPDIPWLRIYNTSNRNKGILLEGNLVLKAKLERDHPKLNPHLRTEFLKVKSGDFNNYINAKIVYPPNFDRSKKYAVLFSVYGGPATQNVAETWNLGFETGYLSSNYDIIIAYVDARGTMARGERYKHAVYHHLGRNEALDTIAVAKEMQKNMPFVDPGKISIWGWSYGGFLSSYVLGSQTSKVFKLAMAVAPVADWKYYDSIYTERYMGLPKYNPKGYKESSVLPLVKNYKGVHYLLVHGTGDDNVHFQNSAQLVRALTQEEIEYRVQFYTDKNHSLGGEGTRPHLFHLLASFLVEKLHIRQ